MADRVKQTLFAILEPELPGAAVLDLFAGSGAAGIEALSRGAARAIFVEQDRRAARVIEQNLERAGLSSPGAVVIRADAVEWLAEPGPMEVGPFDAVIVDPPYDQPALLARALELLGAEHPRLLRAHARVVAKHFWGDPAPGRIGLLASERERRFGETSLTFYREGA